MMSYDLYEELIVEIFTWLPAKSLLRFRSVSKSLCACIGNPKFIHLHALRSPNKLLIRHQVPCEVEPYVKNVYTIHSGDQLSHNPFTGIAVVEDPSVNFKIVGSCNGILCIYEYGNGINLWNPSIRRRVTVHDRPSWSDSEGMRNPIGFGFDPIIDDYKILVKAKSNTEKGVVRSTLVYTVKTDTWREIACPASPYSYLKPGQRFFNGSMHWVAIRYLTDTRDVRLSYAYIWTFDLSSEVFSRIELPEPRWETNQVTVIKGCLAVMSSKHDDSWIWVWRECVWSVAFKLNSHEFEGAHRVFQLNANDDLLFNPSFGGIIFYNPKTGAWSTFVGLTGYCRKLLVTPCVESLELLDMGTSCAERKEIVRYGDFMW